MRASCQAGDPEEPPAAVASNPVESKSIPRRKRAVSRDIFEAFNEVAPWRALKHQPTSLKVAQSEEVASNTSSVLRTFDGVDSFPRVPMTRALKHQPSSLKDLHLKASSLKASKIAQSEERKERINSWQLMYCGGAQAVIKSLQEIHEKYKMPLKIESFDW